MSVTPVKDCVRAPCSEVGEEQGDVIPAEAGIQTVSTQTGSPLKLCGDDNRCIAYSPRRIGTGILLAQAAPSKRALAPGPPSAETNKQIIDSLPLSMREGAKAALASPSNSAGRVLSEMFELFGREDTGLFSVSMQRLSDWGLIKGIDSLGGPKGRRLLELFRKGRQNSGTVVNNSLLTMLEAYKVITKADLEAGFNGRDTWLDDLFSAAGAMSVTEGWKALHFGISTLSQLSLIKTGNLSSAFAYEEGSMLYEMAKATGVVQAGRDFFGFLLKDWLLATGATELNPAKVGEFIRQTAPAAKRFFEAGQRQRMRSGKSGDRAPSWQIVSGNFRGILPMNDIPKLLDLLAKTLDNPFDPSLPNYIEQEWNVSLERPASLEDLRFVRYYGDFLSTLTQDAGVKMAWIRTKDAAGNGRFSALAQKYRSAAPEDILDMINVLNSIDEKLGETWIKENQFLVPAWEGFGNPITVPVDIVSLKATYARYSLIKVLDEKQLKKYKFEWKKSESVAITVANLANMMVSIRQLTELIGGQGAIEALGGLSVSNMQLDLTGIPSEIMTLKGLYNIRSLLNEASSASGNNNGGAGLIGSQYVIMVTRLFSQAVVVADSDARANKGGRFIPLGLMLKLLFGWSDFRSIEDIPHARDLTGNAKTLAGYIAAAVARFFDNNPAELSKLSSAKEVRMKLKDLQHPLKSDSDNKLISDDMDEFIRRMMEEERGK